MFDKSLYSNRCADCKCGPKDDCPADIEDFRVQKEMHAAIRAEDNAAHYISGIARAEAFDAIGDKYLALNRDFLISADLFNTYSRRVVAQSLALNCRAQGEICKARARRAAEDIANLT
jgi:hypothetical protein